MTDERALRSVIESGDVNVTSALLAAEPALATMTFKDGSTPLHLAAGENRPAIVELLAGHGADVNARYGPYPHTPLSWALTCWSFDAAKKLVELGAAVDLFCASGL